MTRPYDHAALVALVGRLHGALTETAAVVGELHQLLAEPEPESNADEVEQLSLDDVESDNAAADCSTDHLSVDDPADIKPEPDQFAPEPAYPASPWHSYVRDRPELKGLILGAETTPRLLAALAARIDAADHTALLSDAGELPEYERGSDPEMDAMLATFSDHPAGIGERLPQAVRAILDFASHGIGLGLINLRAGMGDPWLTEFTDDHYTAYRAELLEALNRLAAAADADDKARDAAVWLDQWLRVLVPAVAGEHGPQLVPPSPNSPWMRALDASMDVVSRIGKSAQPPYEVGLPPLKITYRDAVERHYVSRQDSRAQPGERRGLVIWRFRVWTGQRTGRGSVSVYDHARVVYTES